MNTKHVLKIFNYENSFTLIGLLDDYESLQVKYSKYEAHELNITVNKNIPNTELFRERRFVQLGNVSDCLFIITTVRESIDENGKGGNYLNIQARDCRYLYKRRMIMTINDVETWTETGNAETVLRHLITSQTAGKRSLPITNTIPDNPIGAQITLSEIHTNLYDVIRNYCQQGNIGWKINFDGSDLALVFYLVADVSSVVKFTVDYESLKNGEFEESSENYKNVVYVGGKGSGTNQAIFEAETEIEGDSPSGIDRIETWVSDGSLTTESELQKTGESKLIEYSQKLNFSGNGLEKSPFEFRVHYDIGNIVEVAFGDRKANVEIISIQESWAYNEYNMEFEFGKPINYLSNQFSKMYNLLQKYNSTNSKSSSETKYYTIPTDIEQPIGDVVLDVIGFMGSTGDSDKIFQLYFDSASKTGAKTYHVYVNRLGGTGKLILTTGVQNSETLEINPGTYVAIIYVDENGNVKNGISTEANPILTGNEPDLNSLSINGQTYKVVGSGGGSIVELTQDEYDDLTPEEKSDGTVRVISDSEQTPIDFAGLVIDDDSVANNKTWSSEKIKEISLKFPDYARGVIHTGGTWTATEDCYVAQSVVSLAGSYYRLYVNDIDVTNTDNSQGTYVSTFYGYVKKGDVISGNNYYKVWGLK